MSIGVACITTQVYIDLVASEAKAAEYDKAIADANRLETERDESRGMLSQVIDDRNTLQSMLKEAEREIGSLAERESKRWSPLVWLGLGTGVGALAMGLVWFAVGKW